MATGNAGKRLEADSTTGIGGENVRRRIREITCLDDYKLILSYADGRTRLLDLESYLRDKTGPRSQQLQDRNYFRTVKVSELGETIEWPNGYDICPDLLYKMSCDIEPESLKNDAS